jgi:asparagine synthase (glutamine-hydrolysing)
MAQIVEILLHNPQSPWHEYEEEGFRLWYKGHFFYQNTLLDTPDIVRIFKPFINGNVPVQHDLHLLMQEINGTFSLVLQQGERVICIVDRMRSIPLFYRISPERITISDDAPRMVEECCPSLNEPAALDFLFSGFTFGEETLCTGIFQLTAGEVLVANGGSQDCPIEKFHYFAFIHQEFSEASPEELMAQFDRVVVNVFTRLIETTVKQGKQIVVPLSGGLDSRNIASMLHRLGVRDVICFSYGLKSNREHKISAIVAEKLGYEWHYVEYTPEKWESCMNSPEYQQFKRYSGNFVSEPHLQDFLAVYELVKKGIVRENAVFVPGHSGCSITGSHLPEKTLQSRRFELQEITHDLLIKYFPLEGWDVDEEQVRHITAHIQEKIAVIPQSDRESYGNALEYFEFSERQAKHIINSLRVYEFFDREWRIPECDLELLNFFLHLPIHLRTNQIFYKMYATEILFGKYVPQLRHVRSTTLLETGKAAMLAQARQAVSFIFTVILTGHRTSPWHRYAHQILVRKNPIDPENWNAHPRLKRFFSRNAKRVADHYVFMINYEYLKDCLCDLNPE